MGYGKEFMVQLSSSWEQKLQKGLPRVQRDVKVSLPTQQGNRIWIDFYFLRAWPIPASACDINIYRYFAGKVGPACDNGLPY
jgi:hypothetical protein